MKNKKRLVTFSVFLILVLSLVYGSYRYFNSAGYFLSRLPEKYKHYPTLKDKITSTHHRVTTLFSGAKAKEVYIDPVHNILVITKMTEISKPDQNTELQVVYYRLDKIGNLVDTLKESSSGDMGTVFNGHLLYDGYYSNYLVSGGFGHHSYTDYNRNLNTDTVKLKKLVNSLEVIADEVKSDYETDGGVSKELIVFSVQQKVFRIFTKPQSNVTAQSKYNGAFKTVGPATDYFLLNKRYNWTDSHSFIQIKYFLKQEHNKAWSTGYMAPAPMSAPANWGGVGYFSINFPGDTLFFQHPTYYYDDLDFTDKKPYYDNNMWGKLDFFKIPGFAFQLITVGYDTEDIYPLDGCYLVAGK